MSNIRGCFELQSSLSEFLPTVVAIAYSYIRNQYRAKGVDYLVKDLFVILTAILFNGLQQCTLATIKVAGVLYLYVKGS